MNATDIISQVQALGVRLEVHGDKLRVSPASRVPADMMEALRQHKGAILARLHQEGGGILHDRYQRVYPGDGPHEAELAEIERQVDEHGVCLTWCQTLEDYVAFYLAEDGRAKIPSGFIAYSEAECQVLFGIGQREWSPDAMRRLHDLKKAGLEIVDLRDGGGGG